MELAARRKADHWAEMSIPVVIARRSGNYLTRVLTGAMLTESAAHAPDDPHAGEDEGRLFDGEAKPAGDETNCCGSGGPWTTPLHPTTRTGSGEELESAG